MPSGHNPELAHSRDTPPQWALDKMWTHLTAAKAQTVVEDLAADTDGVWTPAKGDRVRLTKKISALTPVGAEGDITMMWEASEMNGVALPDRFCVDCEGWPPFVTDASNLALVKRAEPAVIPQRDEAT